jgi:hypothetical protein
MVVCDEEGRCHMPARDSAAEYVEITLINSDDLLTKIYEVGPDGMPSDVGSPFLVNGVAKRMLIPVADFATEFAAVLSCIHKNSCVVLGALSDEVEGDIADITTKSLHEPRVPGAGIPLVWRGRDWLGYGESKAAVLGIDHDWKDVPEALRIEIQNRGGFMAVLTAICPALSASARVSRASVSTGIEVNKSGNLSRGGGLHLYLLIRNGGDAHSFASRLHDQLMLAGFGFPFVTESGSILMRSLVDTSASGHGNRLWFEASAVLSDDLHHVPGAREPEAVEGPILDTESALLPLTDIEAVRLREIHADLRARVEPLARENRRLYVERVRETLTHAGGGAVAAEGLADRLLDAEARGVLGGQHLLHLDDGRSVTVMDVLADRSAYHRATCSDPLEPWYGGGRNKAIIFTDCFPARIFTHAHGGRLFDLGLNESDVVGVVQAAQSEGNEPTTPVENLAADISFSAGGWTDVEVATGWRAPSNLAIYQPLAVRLSPGKSGDEKGLLALTRPDPNPVINRVIHQFNGVFAVVAEGGSASVVRLAYNAELKRHMPVTMSLESFKLTYGNAYVSIPSSKRDGTLEQVSAASLWLRHSARRTCPDGFGIDPTGSLPITCWNLWQGFGVVEKQGDWSKLQEMILTVLAAGNLDHAEYIISWLAHLVQRPDENPGVALVFRGQKGTGKGTLGRAIMRLMRPHAMQITHTKHLTGPFNSHMRSVLFLFADEAFFAGDKANEGALKGLITEDFRINEGKGRDATLGRNRLHLMMASNNNWVVPASAEARRYAVFDVASIHRQDTDYFGAILAEMDVDGEAAGIAAMLYDLRRFPVNLDFVRKAPETAGLHAQRLASLRGPASWLMDVLMRGWVKETARKGDVIVCWRLDRIGRSLRHLIEMAEQLQQRGIGLRSLTEAIDTSTSAGRFMFSILGALGQMEREIIVERTRAGLQAAAARGRVGGRPPALDEAQIRAARAMLASGNMSAIEVAQQLGCAASTLYRHLPGGRSAITAIDTAIAA